VYLLVIAPCLSSDPSTGRDSLGNPRAPSRPACP
jgi:hypothetical protein